MQTVIKPRADMSDEEWALRQQLAACYRIFAMQGWDELVYNHISVRLPREDDAFLINPFGLHFSEVCASNLIKINIQGEKLEPSPYPVNRAGFVQHSVFHKEIPDAHTIVHTHTTATMAVCSLEGGLQPINFYAANMMGHLAYHDFEGITVREEEGVRLISNLGDKRILMLKNHGPVVLAKSIPEAFLNYWALQRACEIQLATLSMGKPVNIPQEVINVHQRDAVQVQSQAGAGQAEFASMVRLVDKIDTTWRN